MLDKIFNFFERTNILIQEAYTLFAPIFFALLFIFSIIMFVLMMVCEIVL